MLHIVLEDGHNNAEDAARIYKWVQDRVKARRAVAGLTFRNKKDCLPLAAADYFAYIAWGENQAKDRPRSGKESCQIRSLLSRQYVLDRFKTANSLDSLHEQAIKFAQERLSFGRSNVSP